MAVDPVRAAALALALPGARQCTHFDRQAFRTTRRMFATLAASGETLNLMFDPDLRDLFCSMAPHAFAPVPGGWGQKGATTCTLQLVDEPTLHAALVAAHKRAERKRRPSK